MTNDPTQRFTYRVDHYVRARPNYPAAFYDFLRNELGLGNGFSVADIGSGTGISARPLVEGGEVVYAVEPNAAMRGAAEQWLGKNANFHSINGTGEATTLPSGSVDLVLVAQAFHWLDRARARPEFIRILKPPGWVVLVWNERRLDSTPFLREYEALLQRFGTDYNTVRHDLTEEGIVEFFRPAGHRTREFENAQRFDYAGLESRLLSSSYVPGPDHPDHAAMVGELRKIFDRYQQGGQVAFEYDTRAHFGHLS